MFGVNVFHQAGAIKSAVPCSTAPIPHTTAGERHSDDTPAHGVGIRDRQGLAGVSNGGVMMPGRMPMSTLAPHTVLVRMFRARMGEALVRMAGMVMGSKGCLCEHQGQECGNYKVNTKLRILSQESISPCCAIAHESRLGSTFPTVVFSPM